MCYLWQRTGERRDKANINDSHETVTRILLLHIWLVEKDVLFNVIVLKFAVEIFW
jgi:hypothetical protein